MAVGELRKIRLIYAGGDTFKHITIHAPPEAQPDLHKTDIPRPSSKSSNTPPTSSHPQPKQHSNKTVMPHPQQNYLLIRTLWDYYWVWIWKGYWRLRIVLLYRGMRRVWDVSLLVLHFSGLRGTRGEMSPVSRGKWSMEVFSRGVLRPQAGR